VLFLSSRTVQHHLASIYDKTGQRTRAGAAVFAMQHALVPSTGLSGRAMPVPTGVGRSAHAPRER